MKLARLEGLEHRDKTGLQLPHEAFGKVSPSAAPDGRKRREKGPWAVGWHRLKDCSVQGLFLILLIAMVEILLFLF